MNEAAKSIKTYQFKNKEARFMNQLKITQTLSAYEREYKSIASKCYFKTTTRKILKALNFYTKKKATESNYYNAIRSTRKNMKFSIKKASLKLWEKKAQNRMQKSKAVALLTQQLQKLMLHICYKKYRSEVQNLRQLDEKVEQYPNIVKIMVT